MISIRLLGIFIVFAYFNLYTIECTNPFIFEVDTGQKPHNRLGRYYESTEFNGQNAIVVCESNRPEDVNEYNVYNKLKEVDLNPKRYNIDGRMYLPRVVDTTTRNGHKCAISLFECQYTITEYMQDMNTKRKATQTVPLLNQAIRGFAYLHRLGWTHNNIRPEAICVNGIDKQQPTILIHDFQAATPILYDDANELRLHIPNQPYLIDSPEWKTQTASNLQQADSWSIGAVFYGILLSNTHVKKDEKMFKQCAYYILRETADATTLEAFTKLLLEKVTFMVAGGNTHIFRPKQRLEMPKKCIFTKYQAIRMTDDIWMPSELGLDIISSMVATYPVYLLAQHSRLRAFVNMILQQGVCHIPYTEKSQAFKQEQRDIYTNVPAQLKPLAQHPHKKKSRLRDIYSSVAALLIQSTLHRPTPNELVRQERIRQSIMRTLSMPQI